MNFIHKDTNSITGSNIRHILRLTSKSHWDQVKDCDVNGIEYCVISEENKWRVSFISELVDVKTNDATVEGFTSEEIEEILDFVCTS